MLDGEEVYRAVEVTDNVQTSKLNLLDQIRLIFASLSNDDVAELEKNEAVSADRLKKIASFTKLIDEATRRMSQRGEKSVTLAVSSVYKPFFETVLNDKDGYGRFFNVRIEDRQVTPGINYNIILKLSVKEG